MTKLRECPFCGSEPRIAHSEDADGCYWAKILCDVCGVTTRGKWASTRSDACPIFYAEVRDEWNFRFEDPIPYTVTEAGRND